MPGTQGDQKRASDALELELWTTVSCRVGPMNRGPLLEQVPLTTSPLSRPPKTSAFAPHPPYFSVSVLVVCSRKATGFHAVLHPATSLDAFIGRRCWLWTI